MKKLIKTILLISLLVVFTTACSKKESSKALSNEEYKEQVGKSFENHYITKQDYDCQGDNTECAIDYIEIAINKLFMPISKIYIEGVEETKELQDLSTELISAYNDCIEFIKSNNIEIDSSEFENSEEKRVLDEKFVLWYDHLHYLAKLNIIAHHEL